MYFLEATNTIDWNTVISVSGALLGTIIGIVGTYFIQRAYYNRELIGKKNNSMLEFEYLLSKLLNCEVSSYRLKYNTAYEEVTNPDNNESRFSDLVNNYNDINAKAIKQLKYVCQLHKIDKDTASTALSLVNKRRKQDPKYLDSIIKIHHDSEPINAYAECIELTQQLYTEISNEHRTILDLLNKEIEK